MVNKILYHNALGEVGVGHANPELIKAMIGSGGIILRQDADREIAKHLIETPEDQAAFNRDWAAFLATKQDTPRGITIRAFILALVWGKVMSEDLALGMVAAKDMGSDYIGWEIVDESQLPYHIRGNGDPAHIVCLNADCHDRYFRNCCRWSPTGVFCDMSACRELHMGVIRKVRDMMLKVLDGHYIRALSTGNAAEQTRVVTIMQTLRDIPQTFDLSAYATPETLKAAWPKMLPYPERMPV